jgi:ABC-type multidrug transport system ATPase subunit
LYFYARLKGVLAKDEQTAVKASLDTVALGPFENRLTKGLSGGEKRRLSIAIALIGDPAVVFLDGMYLNALYEYLTLR